MSYRELTMIEIKEVLRRWQAGHSVRKIGRETSVGRKAAARYIHWAVELGVARDRELRDEDVHAVAQCVQSRPEHDESDEWRAIAQHRETLEKWLSDKPPLRLTKVHTLLKRRGLEVSYATVRRYAMQELGWHKKQPTIRLEDPPAGQEAQVDFGRMGYLAKWHPWAAKRARRRSVPASARPCSRASSACQVSRASRAMARVRSRCDRSGHFRWPGPSIAMPAATFRSSTCGREQT